MSSDVKHDYHLVDPSPWPLVGSIGAFTMLLGAVFWMNKDYTGFWGLPLNGQLIDEVLRHGRAALAAVHVPEVVHFEDQSRMSFLRSP